jgi:formate hydrogenlyase transcriptional activator
VGVCDRLPRVRGTVDTAVDGLGEAQGAALLGLLTAVASHRHREPLFDAIAGAIEPIVGFDMFCVVLDGPAPGFMSAYFVRPRMLIPPMPRASSALDRVFTTGEPLHVRNRDEAAAHPGTLHMLERMGSHSYLALPIEIGGRTVAALLFQSSRPHAYDDTDMTSAVEAASIVALALENCMVYEEVDRARQRLIDDNAVLRGELDEAHGPAHIIGTSAPMREALRLVGLVAPTDATALVTGETGTGEELVARAIHEQSARADKPLVMLNCAAIPAGLLESELFGHEAGAFTDAARKRRGRFEMAHRGTLFLDEIGELPAEAQAKLLRVLQEQEFERLGGSETVKADVRVIAATNRDLAVMVGEGAFRADLYYRLAVFPIALPPLRDRDEDIPPLARAFLRQGARRLGRRAPALDAHGLAALRAYRWPGNVRELQNVIERALILSRGARLDVEALLPTALEAQP